MSKLKITFDTYELYLDLPLTLTKLANHLLTKYSISRPTFKYLDEDREFLTVNREDEFAEAIKFLVPHNEGLIVEEKTRSSRDLNEMIKFQDKSCGITNKEVPSQTKAVEYVEKSSEINISYIDIGLDVSEDISGSLIHSSSQIPKMEKFSKVIGNEYSEKSTSSVKEMKSEASEVFMEEPNEDFSLQSMRKAIRDEISLLGSFCRVQHSSDVSCCNCYIKPIVGIRYKCTQCSGFSLCEDCEEIVDHEHSLLKLKVPENLDEKTKVVEKIIALGFKDVDKVKKIAKECGYDYVKTMTRLLGVE
ncbi:hypothetical protein SteCoe_21250 [Stentor coeruleus]|uniref:ZZ-type domain-containing protein n=1 Tax=Stentor coeruleus TaxID=5963 RepID=A0A1R2BPT8_9CILI|nr:hypothetical protein SteCoe_21250 [Stentor coeruleus]